MWRIGLLTAFVLSSIGVWVYKDDAGRARLSDFWAFSALFTGILLASSMEGF